MRRRVRGPVDPRGHAGPGTGHPSLAGCGGKKQGHGPAPQPAPSGPIPEDVPDPSPGPEELAQRRDQSARLWAAVDALDEPDRTLFVRYYYEGDKLKTVAAELGLSQTAAKQRLFRGRKALKAALQEGAETR